jgi:hypothetical protein
VLIVSVLLGTRHVSPLAMILFGLGMFCLLWSLLYTVLEEPERPSNPRPRR